MRQDKREDLISTFEAEIRRLWSIIPAFSGLNGILNYSVDVVTGAILDQRTTIQDYGDYVQYAVWAAERFQDPSLESWALGQVFKGSEIFQEPQGFFLAGHSTSQLKRKVPVFEYFRLEDNTDLLMGMVSLWRYTKNPGLVPAINKLFEFVSQTAPQGLMRGNVFYATPARSIRLPFRIPDGLFVEEAVNWGVHGGHPAMLDLARRLLAQWDHVPLFCATGLFPVAACTSAVDGLLRPPFTSLLDWARSKPGRPPTRWKLDSAFLIKSNTNMISGALALNAAAPAANLEKMITRWCDFVVANMMRDDGFFFGAWDGHRNAPQTGPWPLADNHHITNILLDAHFHLKQPRWLDAARKNAEFWMSHTSPLGLKPELYRKGAESTAVVDMQVDYLVVLLKLFELTHDLKYRDHVLDCITKFLPLFRAPHGVYWSMDAFTGENRCARICTKFLGLYTKLLLLTIESLEDKPIYQHPSLFDLSRDR